MQTSGVIFDVDGTLVDSYGPHYESWKMAAVQEGVTFTPEQFRKAFGLTSRDIIKRLWAHDVTESQILAIDDIKERAYRGIAAVNFPAMDGAEELLKMLHSHGFKLGIGSSGPKENVDLAVRKLAAENLLDAVISGSDVSRAKPDPEIFLTAAANMRILPQRCVVVEDSTIGIRAAHAAGMKCIGIMSTGHLIEELKNADQVIDSLREITPEMLRHLIGVKEV
ncbi:MAG: HAD family phosphatase [Planctomycetaceae bacterium]|jgi:beta-phosphoglucomutase|nr:HAD family phosphatase [Planctomycetaceae bacterium]